MLKVFMVNKNRLVLLFGSIYQHFIFGKLLPVLLFFFVFKNNAVLSCSNVKWCCSIRPTLYVTDYWHLPRAFS